MGFAHASLLALVTLLHVAAGVELACNSVNNTLVSSAGSGTLLLDSAAVTSALDCTWTIGSAGALTQLSNLIADSSWLADSVGIYGISTLFSMFNLRLSRLREKGSFLHSPSRH